MSDIPDPPHLGPTLREKRTDLTWTLDRLATESGVSRSMLSEIERGDANPTFATLWSITQAIGLEIHELMAEAEDRQRVATIEVTRPTFVPTMSSDDGRVTLRALGPIRTADAVEWYVLDFEPNGSLRSTAHVAGTEEHLTVLTGTLAVRSGESSETISDGATARYRGDLNHEITNSSDKASASAILVVLGAQR